MNTVLKLQASIQSDRGESSRLAAAYTAAFVQDRPGTVVIERDLARDPVPHLDAGRFGAFLTPPDQRTAQQHAVAGYSDALIDELRRADTLVIGLPMYNFGLPSTLKAYFDHVARAGITFRYTANGPEGLLKGKKAVVFATRGGLYAGTARDTQTAYLRDFLAFLGIEDVEFVYAEGLAMGEAVKRDALQAANQALRAIAQRASQPVAQAA